MAIGPNLTHSQLPRSRLSAGENSHEKKVWRSIILKSPSIPLPSLFQSKTWPTESPLPPPLQNPPYSFKRIPQVPRFHFVVEVSQSTLSMAGLLKSQQLSAPHQFFSRPPRLKIRGIARSQLGSPYNPASEAREVEFKNPQYDNDSRVLKVSVTANNDKDSKILVPPRVCTLRAFGKDGDGVLEAEPGRTPSFFQSLAASIDHSAKIKDWEILSGRMAMIVFAATINVEALTGNSLFHKMDVQKICEFGGVCLASIVCAAGLAWGSRAKTRMGSIFSARCNEFVDGVIDQLVDSLFYEEDQQ